MARRPIAFRIGQPGQQTLQARVLEAWAEQLEQRPRRGHAAARLVDPTVLLHRQRLIKDAHELERLREARPGSRLKPMSLPARLSDPA